MMSNPHEWLVCVGCQEPRPDYCAHDEALCTDGCCDYAHGGAA